MAERERETQSMTPERAVASSSMDLMQVIEPPRGWSHIGLGEVWRFRELFGFMVWRDVKVKYKQTLLGAAWAILVPLMQMLIFSLIFGRLAGMPSDGLPSSLFYFAGLLPWTYFATALAMSSNSLVGNSQLLTKVYFPRLIVPASPCIAGLLDFAIAFLILVVMMIYYRVMFPLASLLLPLLVLMALGTALAAGLFLSALNVKYRDIRYVIPFLVQMWMYCTVILPFSAIPERFGLWRYLYGLNPMAGVVEGFRWCLLHPHMSVEKIVSGETVKLPVEAPWILIAIGLAVLAVMLGGGLYYFKRMERQFADVV
jgi:lipopolysaccharide transport system permease protein